jgi:hypothetical protein
MRAHEITCERQILAMACLIGVRERSGDDGAKFGDVAHVYAPHSWIKGEGPAHGSVRLLLRS